jgi:hypothetical protein
MMRLDGVGGGAEDHGIATSMTVALVDALAGSEIVRLVVVGVVARKLYAAVLMPSLKPYWLMA